MEIAWDIMKWPLLACLVLPGLLVYFGLHIVRRGVIFVDLALAQVATLGTAWCLMRGHDVHDLHTHLWSVGFTLVGAFIFAMTRAREHHRVPQEALIGIVYVVAAAAGLLLLSRTTEGNEELKKMLIGDVLTVTWDEIWKTFLLYTVIGVIHFVFRRKFFAVTFDPVRAQAEGISIRLWDFLFYALFGLVVVSFVQIGGVLLVFSYLIVPAVCANFLAVRFGVLLALGWITATLASVVGLAASYQFDLPTGAAIVCALGAMLVVVAVIARFRKPV
ncbi:MAG: metal ABC transporter permease [Verrucomicrobia bacterium]|nr:metal ABC transporter permease [Verrucomicrobiota bacterium]